MTPAFRHFLRLPWITQLLLASLLFQALIPAGFMPDIGHDGTVSLKLCAGVRPSIGTIGDTASLGDNGGGAGDHSDSAHNDLCPFSAQLQVATPGTPAAHVVPVFGPLLLVGPEAELAYSSAAHYFRLPRGPPAQV